jgi:cell wall-associated NlpC family hydrolase
MMDDIAFAEKMTKFFGQSFNLGDRGKKGWDCLTSMADFFESCGIKFPLEFRDWNEKNYAERWERGEGMDVFRDFLYSLGEPVDRNYMQPGDIIIFEMKDVVSAGVYLGSGHFQAVDRKRGIVRLPLRYFNIAIKGVRRLLPR